MTSYEQQMLHVLQRIFDLLDVTLVPILDEITYLFYWIEDFLTDYAHFIYALGFGILIILTLKWLSRW